MIIIIDAFKLYAFFFLLVYGHGNAVKHCAPAMKLLNINNNNKNYEWMDKQLHTIYNTHMDTVELEQIWCWAHRQHDIYIFILLSIHYSHNYAQHINTIFRYGLCTFNLANTAFEYCIGHVSTVQDKSAGCRRIWVAAAQCKRTWMVAEWDRWECLRRRRQNALCNN